LTILPTDPEQKEVYADDKRFERDEYDELKDEFYFKKYVKFQNQIDLDGENSFLDVTEMNI